MAETRRVLPSSDVAVAAAAFVALGGMLVAAAPASAEGARVLEAERKVEQAAFAADAATGRAWVDVTVARRFATGKEARARGTRVPVALGELVYDAATHAVVLVDGETRTTCAVLADDAVIATGACRIVATTETRPVDTAFGSAPREHVVVRITR
jgi:hypothetical protein